MDRDQLVLDLEQAHLTVLGHFATPASDWEKTYAPGKWTIRQILAHLADAEIAFLSRVLHAVAEPESNVDVWDENRWCAELDYINRPVELSRQLFNAAGSMLIYYARTIPDDAFERTVIHPEKGQTSAATWLAVRTKHALHHSGQIACAREGRTWSPSTKIWE